MKTFLILLTALTLWLESEARIMHSWTYQQLTDEATLIVVATPTKVALTSERAPLPNIQTQHADGRQTRLTGVGLETTFDVLTVLKGDAKTTTLCCIISP
jgi:hypothetical protein